MEDWISQWFTSKVTFDFEGGGIILALSTFSASAFSISVIAGEVSVGVWKRLLVTVEGVFPEESTEEKETGDARDEFVYFCVKVATLTCRL